MNQDFLRQMMKAFQNIEIQDQKITQKSESVLQKEIPIVLKQIQKYLDYDNQNKGIDNVSTAILNEYLFVHHDKIIYALQQEDWQSLAQLLNIREKLLIETFQNCEKKDYYGVLNYLIQNNQQVNKYTDFKMFSIIKNNQQIFTFLAPENGPNYEVKLIIRDCAGKNVWKFKYYPQFDESILEMEGKQRQESLKKLENIIKSDAYFEKCKNFENEYNYGQIKQNCETFIKVKNQDMEEQNNDKLENEEIIKISDFQEKSEENQKQLQQKEQNGIKKNILQEIVFEINEQDKMRLHDNKEFEIINNQEREEFQIQAGQAEKDDQLIRKDIQEKNKEKQNIDIFRQSVNDDVWKGARMLLTQLHLLADDNIKWSYVNDPYDIQWINFLHLLDKAQLRESIKIGVLYVDKNQSQQNEILANQQGSKNYEYFVENLGIQKDFKTHLGFTGGLKYDVDGKKLSYYADELCETVFHIATQMPKKQGDDDFIQKKRHIGNDHVNIVWSENQRRYRHYTISSQFNFSIIIIYPQKNNLFRIQFSNKENVSQFFPWLDKSLVTFDILIDIIRISAQQAHRSSRNYVSSLNKQKVQNIKPMQYRKDFIKENAQKYGKNISKTEFNSLLYTGKIKKDRE